MPTPPTIGVLAIQGDFAAHAAALRSLGAHVVEVRKPAQLDSLDGLIIPGGESTTILRFLAPGGQKSDRDGLFDALAAFAQSRPTFGTCAGCILLAKEVTHPPQRSLAVMDITVQRNAYGRQNDSAILAAPTELPGPPLEMVFIRAPRITRTGPDVQVLARRGADPVLVRERHLLAATFHPEISPDPRVHALFLTIVNEHRP